MENTGQYKTKQREMILELLKNNSDKHLTAEDVIGYLKEQETPVGKATVYRYLERLEEQGIIRKYLMPEGKGACYQYSGDTRECHRHYHFKCEKCGKLFHVQCEYLDGISKHVYGEHGFTIDSSKTVYYGICRNCNS
ncbi:MAG: transcriptional repressor [Lachnospiraceae bacterium]|nr:transcriptional repressor [Lachnospiraceae bacterium]